jgi:hypothetical protein
MLPSRVRRFALLAALAAAGLAAGACLPPPRTEGPTSAPASNEAGPTAGASSGSPGATPTPKGQDSAIEAFVAQVATGSLTYHVAFSGDVRASVDRLPIAGAMDVAGNDFATSFTYDFEPDYPGHGKVRVQVRGVDDRAWIKRGSAGWASVKTYGLEQSYVPFKTVKAPRDVKYLGPVTIGGSTYYKVAIRDALLIHPNTIPYQIQHEEVQATELDVLIDAGGTPRSGSWELRGQARIGAGDGQLQHVVYDLKLTFSKVGARIAVSRP